MPDRKLVGLTDLLDQGRQRYNEAVRTYYSTDRDAVPAIDGLLKSLHDPSGGKARLLGRIDGRWVVFAFEDPIPTDLMFYDSNNNLVKVTVPINGTDAKFENLETDALKVDSINADSGKVKTLTVDILNVNDRINQTLTEQLNVADNTILLNSNLASDVDPDAVGLIFTGIVVNRGAFTESRLIWDEPNNRWILEVPDDSNVPAKTLELFGITDDLDRKVEVKNSSGVFFDAASANKNPGSYIAHSSYTSGIYWDNTLKKYVVKDETSKFELVGIELNEPGRKLIINNSTGIKVNNYTNEKPSLDFVQKNPDHTDNTKGSIVFDPVHKRFLVSTVNGTFVIRDLYELNPFGDSWYYSVVLNDGEKNIVLPANKPIMNTNEELTMVFINGLIQKPDSYQILDSNRIVLNVGVSTESTVTVYHHVFMHSSYRLPEKSLPVKITGVTGKEATFAHSSNIVIGNFTGFVLKNNVFQYEGLDFVFERLSDTEIKIKFVQDLVNTDVVIVYPFVTPNLWLKGENGLIFDSLLSNPDNSVEGSAHIIFRRGSNLPAGIRWNEQNNQLEFDSGTGIWETFSSSAVKTDKKRIKIEAVTNRLSLEDMFARNGIILSIHKNLNLLVVKNGVFQDSPNDYQLVGKELIFTNPLNINDVVWVSIGQAFVKSQNHLTNKKDIQIVQADTKLIKFSRDFKYEPGTDMLSIFVNGMLTEKDIDYTEVDESSVRFNYRIEAGTVIQAFVPTITDLFKYSKKIFEFNITDVPDFLNNENSNCFISVNRGSNLPAAIKWDEVNNHWYISEGDGVYHRIMSAAQFEDKQYTQFREYIGATNNTIDLLDMIGTPTKLLVYKNGNLLHSSQYTYTKDTKKISFNSPVDVADKISVLAYTSGEIAYIKEFGSLDAKKFTKQLDNEDRVTIDLEGNYNTLPILNVYINGVLLHESKYVATLVNDNSFLNIQFTKTYFGELAVNIISSKSTHSIVSGEENRIFFRNNQGDNYEDTKPLGNFWIIKDRGKALKPAYLKWDEVENDFVFNDGRDMEYKIPKVVFANSLYTPDNGEEVLLINKTTGKLHAFFNNSWSQLN